MWLEKNHRWFVCCCSLLLLCYPADPSPRQEWCWVLAKSLQVLSAPAKQCSPGREPSISQWRFGWARMQRKPKSNQLCAHYPLTSKSSPVLSCIVLRDLALEGTAKPPGGQQPAESAAEQLGDTHSWLPISYMEFFPLLWALKAMFYILIKLKEKELDNSLKDLQATSISENDSCSH